MKNYIFSMVKYANKTRNVHKELKNNLEYTGKVLPQYTKTRNTGKNAPPISKGTNSLHTQIDPIRLISEIEHNSKSSQSLIHDSLNEMQIMRQKQNQQIQSQLTDISNQQRIFQQQLTKYDQSYQVSLPISEYVKINHDREEAPSQQVREPTDRNDRP